MENPNPNSDPAAEGSDAATGVQACRKLPLEVLWRIISFVPEEYHERRRTILAATYVCKEWAPKMKHVFVCSF